MGGKVRATAVVEVAKIELYLIVVVDGEGEKRRKRRYWLDPFYPRFDCVCVFWHRPVYIAVCSTAVHFSVSSLVHAVEEIFLVVLCRMRRRHRWRLSRTVSIPDKMQHRLQILRSVEGFLV